MNRPTPLYHLVTLSSLSLPDLGIEGMNRKMLGYILSLVGLIWYIAIWSISILGCIAAYDTYFLFAHALLTFLLVVDGTVRANLLDHRVGDSLPQVSLSFDRSKAWIPISMKILNPPSSKNTPITKSYSRLLTKMIKLCSLYKRS